MRQQQQRRRGGELTFLFVLGAICYLTVLYKGQVLIHQAHHDDTNRTPSAQERDLSSFRLTPQVSNNNNNNNTANDDVASTTTASPKFGSLDMKLKFERNPGDNRPPFDTMFDQHGNLTQAVSSILHFAVIGFGKCGTTSIISWLDRHPQIQSFPREVYDLMLDVPNDLVRKIYSMPIGNYKRGYKSPVDMSLPHTMRYFQEYWPHTKLLVGIRHPIDWFESLYNFRIQNLSDRTNHTTFLRPNQLVGRCFRDSRNTCTYKGEFGLFLRNLGKTLAVHNPRDPVSGRYMVTDLERRMYMASRMKPFPDIQQAVPNPVFLFEMRQLSMDENPTRVTRFRQDVERFMELETPLPPMIWQKPGKNWQDNEQLQSLKDQFKINICDDEHIPARMDLMRMARASSVWIRNYLLDDRVLNTSGVVVSSPQYLRSLLKDWMVDPCGENATKQAGRYILQAAALEDRQRQEVHASTTEEVEESSR